MCSPLSIINQLASAIRLFRDEAIKLAHLIIEAALSAAVFVHALKWGVRILTDH